MKLITAVVRSDDMLPITRALIGAGFSATCLGSTGAYLAIENVTVICGVEDDEIDEALKIIRQNAKAHNYNPPFDPKELADISGAVVFVTDVIHFERLGKLKSVQSGDEY